MRDKIALEEHGSTEAMNALWDDAGEASRNGQDHMNWVEERLLDIPKRLTDMDECGIAMTILSMTSPGCRALPAASEPATYLRGLLVAGRVGLGVRTRDLDARRASHVERRRGQLHLFALS